jgi:hypothetical protein
MESYILTRSMHLGYLKETFGQGAVITFNPETRRLTIDGRHFDDYRDLEILKRQAAKKPHAPWIVPYSEEVLQDLRGGAGEAAPPVPKRASNSEGLEVVQSDEDLHETIDISDTKVSVRNQEKKEAQRQRVKDEGMEIVQGDETVEERIARLKSAKDTDLAARAERVRLMSERKASLPVVKDDSLGSVGGSKSAAMNAGQLVGGRRAEETPETVAAAAAARKAEVERNRQMVAAEQGIDPDTAGIDEATPVPATQESIIQDVANDVSEKAVQETVDMKDAEIAELKARLAALEAEKAEEVPEAPRKVKKTPVVTEEA